MLALYTLNLSWQANFSSKGKTWSCLTTMYLTFPIEYNASKGEVV